MLQSLVFEIFRMFVFCATGFVILTMAFSMMQGKKTDVRSSVAPLLSLSKDAVIALWWCIDTVAESVAHECKPEVRAIARFGCYMVLIGSMLLAIHFAMQ